MAVDSVSSGDVLSVDEMLARSKAAAAANSSSKKGLSTIQKMLQGRDVEDTVDISPVAKLISAQTAKSKEDATPFYEEEWYIKGKVAQLKLQIELYSTLPGLDPSGAIMGSLTQEVNDLVGKQQAKLKASQDEAAAKQAELDKIKNDPARFIPSAAEMIKRLKKQMAGQEVGAYNPDATTNQAVQDMLKKASDFVKGS